MPALLSVIEDCANFKVKINATAALARLSRYGANATAARALAVAVDGHVGSSSMADFAQLKYQRALRREVNADLFGMPRCRPCYAMPLTAQLKELVVHVVAAAGWEAVAEAVVARWPAVVEVPSVCFIVSIYDAVYCSYCFGQTASRLCLKAQIVSELAATVSDGDGAAAQQLQDLVGAVQAGAKAGDGGGWGGGGFIGNCSRRSRCETTTTSRPTSLRYAPPLRRMVTAQPSQLDRLHRVRAEVSAVPARPHAQVARCAALLRPHVPVDLAPALPA